MMADNINNTDNKLEFKRLLIYIALSFGLTWLIFFAFIFTGFRWDGSNINMEQFISLGMLMPFTAHILTRIITKEGMAITGKDSLMLGISFKDKKWIFFLIAMITPWIYTDVSNLILLALVPASFDTGMLKELDVKPVIAFVYPFIAIVSCSIMSFAALGEEGGWRGYMMPKLIKLIGFPKAIIIGGIIWGIWHAPLTCVGHNFGTDYVGFPYLGILIMCINCILMGIMLTFVTMKTQSIWPAAIMHAINNGGPSILGFFINSDTFTAKYPNLLLLYLTLKIPMLIIDLVIIIYVYKSKSNK